MIGNYGLVVLVVGDGVEVCGYFCWSIINVVLISDCGIFNGCF